MIFKINLKKKTGENFGRHGEWAYLHSVRKRPFNFWEVIGCGDEENIRKIEWKIEVTKQVEFENWLSLFELDYYNFVVFFFLLS